MEFEQITCPYCWQKIDIEAPGYAEQDIEMTLDCEVCCRPIRVRFSWDEETEPPFIDVEAES